MRLALYATIIALVVSATAAELALRHGAVDTLPHLQWEIQRQGDASGPLLLILGDSFFARRPGGGDINDRLRDDLRAANVQILNPSVAGTGPYRYLELLVQALRDVRPQVVLISHYVGNDLMDVGCPANADALLERSLAPPVPRLYQRSLLWQQLQSLAQQRLVRHPDFDWAALTAAGVPPDDVAAAQRFELNPYVLGLGATYPSYYRDTLLFESDCARAAWANSVKVFDEMLRLSAGAGAVVAPVIFPQTLQVSTLHHDLYRRWKIDVSDQMLASRMPQDLLLGYYAAHHVEALDLLPAFRSAEAQLFWDRDEHLNHAGEELAAREIARFLTERVLPHGAADGAAPPVR